MEKNVSCLHLLIPLRPISLLRAVVLFLLTVLCDYLQMAIIMRRIGFEGFDYSRAINKRKTEKNSFQIRIADISNCMPHKQTHLLE
jgi:hypothetical protein